MKHIKVDSNNYFMIDDTVKTRQDFCILYFGWTINDILENERAFNDCLRVFNRKRIMTKAMKKRIPLYKYRDLKIMFDEEDKLFENYLYHITEFFNVL